MFSLVKSAIGPAWHTGLRCARSSPPRRASAPAADLTSLGSAYLLINYGTAAGAHRLRAPRSGGGSAGPEHGARPLVAGRRGGRVRGRAGDAGQAVRVAARAAGRAQPPV